jgi:hypothetical protein
MGVFDIDAALLREPKKAALRPIARPQTIDSSWAD